MRCPLAIVTTQAHKWEFDLLLVLVVHIHLLIPMSFVSFVHIVVCQFLCILQQHEL